MTPPRDIWVAPTGSDAAAGTFVAPLRNLQAALNRVTPGSVVHLAAGVYPGNVTTRVNGTPAAPILIEGPQWNANPVAHLPQSAQTATVVGVRGHVLQVADSYYTFGGFSIDGQPAIERSRPVANWPDTSAAVVQRWKDAVARQAVDNRLVYIDSGVRGRGVRGTVIRRMVLTGAGGECVRVRNDSRDTLIEQSVIRWCGMFPKRTGQDRFAFHNGEGVYVGTSPQSRDLAGHKHDATTSTVVRQSAIFTFGSECLDVKENAAHNRITDSTCADNLEPLSYAGSDIELRGSHNVVDDVRITSSTGYGIKIASDPHAPRANRNVIMRNQLSNIRGAAVYIATSARQGRVCGNTLRNNGMDTPKAYSLRC